jgi:hypothetical protein
MIFAENLFVDFDRPPVEWLGLVIFSLGLKQTGEIVVSDGNVRMLLAENLFADLDRPLEERLSLLIFALVMQQ